MAANTRHLSRRSVCLGGLKISFIAADKIFERSAFLEKGAGHDADDHGAGRCWCERLAVLAATEARRQKSGDRLGGGGKSVMSEPWLPDASVAYRDLAPAVLGYLRAERARDPEDLLGEVFLQVTRDLSSFRGDRDDLRRWVFTIARHRLVDDSRRRARRPEQLDRALPDTPAPLPDEALDAELVAALALLTDDQREVIVLRFIADLPLDVVARITRRKSGAVKALQHRGLAALGRILTPSLDAYSSDERLT
jgi:RNA polymerase sigma-70 factor (ECF subfamily)